MESIWKQTNFIHRKELVPSRNPITLHPHDHAAHGMITNTWPDMMEITWDWLSCHWMTYLHKWHDIVPTKPGSMNPLNDRRIDCLSTSRSALDILNFDFLPQMNWWLAIANSGGGRPAPAPGQYRPCYCLAGWLNVTSKNVHCLNSSESKRRHTPTCM